LTHEQVPQVTDASGERRGASAARRRVRSDERQRRSVPFRGIESQRGGTVAQTSQ